ncbi:hypothetical protein ColTof4_07810 [Colletotrichum tofieldiae]|nr:hypothetical protein ColTof3_02661 [Colletotrichum tofieldiae]GKT75387.1 hypothetical protein ColTof4_07810 [Colletotrichum tofieldiae]
MGVPKPTPSGAFEAPETSNGRGTELASLRSTTHIGSPSPIGPPLPQTQPPPRRHPFDDHIRILSDDPVDHGWRAWSVVVGSTAVMIPTFGLMSTVGIFQVYWKENQLEAWSNADISWIISVFGFLAVLLGGPFGILFDSFGPRWLTTPAAIVYCASFIGIAFSSQYWQFMVCFCTAGIGAGRFAQLV